MMKQAKDHSRSRLPRTAEEKKLVPMRLLCPEHGELERLAERDSRSMSAMARLIFLEGLKSFNDKFDEQNNV
ncbi:hypothetical protein [Morganella morganii]|uniref:hypothetical protein n=1 Tax=Morganella morganii TaxID=582 RepID=UPI000A58D067|nr:hypothetical protein [Morganella morganii]